MVALVFGIFAVCLALAIPIGVGIGIATFVPGLLDTSFVANAAYIVRAVVGGVDSTPLLAIPLFMLSGSIMARGGISQKLFDVFAYLVGKRTAGIPMAVVMTCVFYGAICGSGPATTAAVGAMTIPILVSLGYDKVFAAALVASAGGIGIVIPPSIPFILYGMATSTSISALFLAGVIPGLLIAALLMAYVYVYCRKRGEDRARVAENHDRLRERGLARIVRESFWALLTPIIILGGIYTGIVTPTEAGVISVFYALIICLFVYRTIRASQIGELLDEAMHAFAPLGILIALAAAFGRVLTLLQVPQMLAAFFTTNFSSPIPFLMILNLVLLLMGMVMDIGPNITILAPMLLPVVTGLHIDPVHFGVVMVVNLCIGFITPPFGLNLFVAAPMVDCPVETLGRRTLPFVLVYLATLLLITFIPAISLFIL